MKILNLKILARAIGSLLFVETGMLLLCMCVSLIYREQDFKAFILSAAITFLLGFALRYAGRKSSLVLARRDAYIIVAFTWIIFSAFGMLPFLLTGSCSNISDAFFETVSGFTTTGSTIICHVESLSHGILFWRSLTHWTGGLGIVIFTMSIMPAAGEAGIRLFSAEATGPTHEKLHPRIRTTVNWLFLLYFFITLICGIALWLCGMDVFDSVNHALATTSTGGFSTHSESILYYHSSAIEYVETFFMFISGINFLLLFLVFQRRSIKALTGNTECRFYFVTVFIASLAACLALIFKDGHTVSDSIRLALFNVVSIQTTTGFTSDSLQTWWAPIQQVLLIVMIIGGCAGSTAGGAKCVRTITLLKAAMNHFRQMLHPNAFMPVRVNGFTVSEQTERALLGFIFWYAVLTGAATLFFSALSLSFPQAINLTICCLSNIGVSNALSCSPDIPLSDLPAIGKWVCSFLMLAGRLEFYPLLLIFTRSFWVKN